MITPRDRTLIAVLPLALAMLAAIFLADALEVIGVSPPAVFAVATVLLIGQLAMLGVVTGPRGRRLRWTLLGGSLLLAITVVAVVLVDGSPGDGRILGMLPATAIFVLGIWGVPIVLVVGYVAFFREGVVGEAEERRLGEIAQRERRAP